jgi:hypothetical protein
MMSDRTQPSRRSMTLADEWASFLLLARTFLGRIFDSEALSSRGGAPVLLWVAAFIATPGFLRAFRLFTKYSLLRFRPEEVRLPATWPDKLFFVSWALAATGFVTMLAWDALLPDRRDALILQTLPLRRRTTGAARLAALLLFFLAMVVAANGLTMVIYSTMVMESHPGTSYLANILAFAVAVTGASAFVFFSILLLQLLLTSALDPRWFRRAATVAQSASVIMLLLLFLVRPPIPIVGWVRGDAGLEYLSWLPPFWFLGLYEMMLGTPTTVLRAAGARGLMALTGVMLGALALYVLTYGRHLRRMVEAPEAGGLAARMRLWPFLGRVVHWFAPRQVERALFDFVLTTLARSAKHRVIVSGYAGVGVAFVIAGITRAWLQGETLFESPPAATALGLPLIVSFFLIAGMRVSFGTATDAAANWSFRATESADRGQYASGVRKALLVVGGIVPALCALPIFGFVWGLPIALAHAIWIVLLARVLIAIVTLRFPRIPFTYLVVPGSSNVKAWWPLYVAGFCIYAYMTPAIERWWLLSASRLAGFFIVVLVGEIALRVGLPWIESLGGRAPTKAIVYEDEDPLIQLRLVG